MKKRFVPMRLDHWRLNRGLFTLRIENQVIVLKKQIEIVDLESLNKTDKIVLISITIIICKYNIPIKIYSIISLQRTSNLSHKSFYETIKFKIWLFSYFK